MPPRVSTGDRDAVLRQIRWCADVQTLVDSHCWLEENPVGNVEPMQLARHSWSVHRGRVLASDDQLLAQSLLGHHYTTVVETSRPCRDVHRQAEKGTNFLLRAFFYLTDTG